MYPSNEVYKAALKKEALNTEVSGHPKAGSRERKMRDNLQGQELIWRRAEDRGSDLGSGSDEDVKGREAEERSSQLKRGYGSATVCSPRRGGSGVNLCIVRDVLAKEQLRSNLEASQATFDNAEDDASDLAGCDDEPRRGSKEGQYRFVRA